MPVKKRIVPTIHVPALTLHQVSSFILRSLTLIVFHCPLLHVIEALTILTLHCILILPFTLVRDRWRLRDRWSSRQKPTLIQDAAWSLVRLGFGYMRPSIGRIFFSTTNSERLTMQRIGYKKFTRSVRLLGRKGDALRGWWIAQHDDLEELYWSRGGTRDRACIMFIHGGGFAIGSPSFYLEFLVRLRDALAASHPSFKNCAVFAPFYPLAPDQIYPSQVLSVEASYSYLAKHPCIDPTRLILLGDSAGGGLSVALMSSIAKGVVELPKPSTVILMSPWLDLELDLDKQPSLFENASWDFVEPTSLAHFSALLLHGEASKRHTGIIRYLRDYTLNFSEFFHQRSFNKYARETSGTFRFPAKENLPPNGILILSGKREILDSQICHAVEQIGPTSKVVHWRKEAAVHAWPMSLFFLGRDDLERSEGMSAIVSFLVSRAASKMH